MRVAHLSIYMAEKRMALRNVNKRNGMNGTHRLVQLARGRAVALNLL